MALGDSFGDPIRTPVAEVRMSGKLVSVNDLVRYVPGVALAIFNIGLQVSGYTNFPLAGALQISTGRRQGESWCIRSLASLC